MMRSVLPLVFAALLSITAQAASPNVLLICVDDLRPELGCYGVDYIQSPNIDRLASEGRLFEHHYVQAPTCGASRYAMLTGRYGPSSNNALFERAKRMGTTPTTVPPSMPEWFRSNGYTTVSIGKVSHHPGGLGGDNWDDEQSPEMPGAWEQSLMPSGAWQHPRGAMHGLAHGQIRKDAGQMPVYQAAPGADTIYPDGLITNAALSQLQALSDGDQPFFLAIGLIRPHLPFGSPAKYLSLYDGVELPPIPHPEKPTSGMRWHGSGEFMQYQRWGHDPRADHDFADKVRRHYAACVSYADTQVGRILDKLDSLGLAENTVVVLWGDHGFHLGEHAIWGKHALFEESLRSPLILRTPGIFAPGASARAVVESIDIFPTLCTVTGLPAPAFVDGVTLDPLLKDPAASIRRGAISYWGDTQTIRTLTHRLAVAKGGSVQLFDHTTDPGEIKNVAQQQPQVVQQMQEMLAKQVSKKH